MTYDRREIMNRAWEIARNSYRNTSRRVFRIALREAWAEAKWIAEMAKIEASRSPAQRATHSALTALENKDHWTRADHERARELQTALLAA